MVDANKRMKFQTTGNGQNELNGLAGSVRRERGVSVMMISVMMSVVSEWLPIHDPTSTTGCNNQ